jgi:hypothetical protein
VVAPGRSAGRVRGALLLVLLAVGSALAVAGLGQLADLVVAAGVPDATAPVTVRPDESLWQVARRVAPSAEPSVVVARIVEVNGLGSPSVESGRVVRSPVG